jgi:hypothetical protein
MTMCHEQDLELRRRIQERVDAKQPVTYIWVRQQALEIFSAVDIDKLDNDADEGEDPDDEEGEPSGQIDMESFLEDLEDEDEREADEDDDEELREQMRIWITDDDDPEVYRRRQHCFSNHWARGWVRRNGFSLRLIHNEKRVKTDPAVIARLTAEIKQALHEFVERYGRPALGNMDESRAETVPAAKRTIAPRGAEAVQVRYEGDPKGGLTVMCSVFADGDRAPVVAILRGKTPRCEAAARADPDLKRAIDSGELLLFHQKDSWCDAQLAKDYVGEYQRFSHNHGMKELGMLWDVFAAHRAEDVKAFARERKVVLFYIPAGQTGSLQPLDYRIFGNVKAKVREDFMRRMISGETKISVIEAIKTWLRAWRTLTQEAVLKAWEPLLGLPEGFE